MTWVEFTHKYLQRKCWTVEHYRFEPFTKRFRALQKIVKCVPHATLRHLPRLTIEARGDAVWPSGNLAVVTEKSPRGSAILNLPFGLETQAQALTHLSVALSFASLVIGDHRRIGTGYFWGQPDSHVEAYRKTPEELDLEDFMIREARLAQIRAWGYKVPKAW